MLVEIFITSLLTAVSSVGLGSIIIAILNRRWKKQDDNDKQDKEIGENTSDIKQLTANVSKMEKLLSAVVEAQKTTMAYNINLLGSSCIYGGGITLDNKQTIERMYSAYKKLPGADGLCQTTMDEVRRLKIVPSWKEKRNRDAGEA